MGTVLNFLTFVRGQATPRRPGRQALHATHRSYRRPGIRHPHHLALRRRTLRDGRRRPTDVPGTDRGRRSTHRLAPAWLRFDEQLRSSVCARRPGLVARLVAPGAHVVGGVYQSASKKRRTHNSWSGFRGPSVAEGIAPRTHGATARLCAQQSGTGRCCRRSVPFQMDKPSLARRKAYHRNLPRHCGSPGALGVRHHA